MKSYAKVNLSLDVLFKRPDGYHEVETIVQSIDLADRVILNKKGKGIKVICSRLDVPLDENNLAFAAAQRLIGELGGVGLEIELQKNIPLFAGLGGGSSNAASTLWGVNLLYGLGLGLDELKEIGLTIGADVPYFLEGGVVVARGRGELTERLNFADFWLVLVKPAFDISTSWAYRNLDLSKIRRRPKMGELCKGLAAGDVPKIGKLLSNVLEDVVTKEYPVISEIEAKLYILGALGASMTGSGSAVFGIMPDQACAHKVCKQLESDYPWVVVAKTINKGLEIEEME